MPKIKCSRRSPSCVPAGSCLCAGPDCEHPASDGETNGDCSHALQRIGIEASLEPTHPVKTLAHELAHALLHVDRSERALMELEAESVAFVVCDALAIDAGEWTFGTSLQCSTWPTSCSSPVHPSPADLWAVAQTVGLAKKAGMPFLFITTQAKPNATITAQTVAALSAHGRVAQSFLADRVPYAVRGEWAGTLLQRPMYGAGRQRAVRSLKSSAA